ncbi:NADH-quinone oxidoreductase [Prochlorococcus marinus str. XMU1401]|uniref:NADH-quinone oxidoreductase n=1 Tax=Prochlorococcus marinus str. XMU1401 TaxID=2052594 RepID=A0A8I1X0U8_PROMR|nr:NADH-quinone oxidoreductase [Prochlorococcus marinus]MBO8222234.1 NADH-quinone oxidoreductase [Prochlorococcus marinus str. XMU1401]MBW3060612.1 NADH-quinone oxidoreductase [Prochlorococcus marinus str. XMU1401E]MCQ9198141.1 NADH-quinone oxidoreductase [Prochlorococcus marinus XMU1429]PJC84733.1 NADH-quinone oxidoreductase [Prochlorococcus marinus str. XMU1401]
MGNFINSTTLIPLIPLVTSFFVLILLASFNRTLNRLTKPVSLLVALSLLSSAFISLFDYFKKIEEELVLSEFLKFFEEKNLVIHLNLVNEKIIIFFSLIMILIIGISFYKLPRKKGYVSLMISLGLISSSVIFSILLIDFSALI